MESVKLCSHIGADGILQIQMPTTLQEQDVEVVVMVQLLEKDRDLRLQTSEKGKKRSIKEIKEGLRALRQQIPADSLSVREMIEEGRRY